jgi:hypothetical protein
MDSLWFEVSVVCGLTAVGAILLGHFEEGASKLRRILKLIVGNLIVVGLSYFAGRAWAFGFIGALLLGVLYIHAIWLPKHGINGWTGEPKDKYYEFRKWKKR